MNKQFLKLRVLVALVCLIFNTHVMAATTQYTYDTLNRLTQVQYDDGTRLIYFLVISSYVK